MRRFLGQAAGQPPRKRHAHSRLVACPICARDVLESLIEIHAADCNGPAGSSSSSKSAEMGEMGGPGSPASQRSDGSDRWNSQGALSPGKREQEVKKKKNALAFLMTAANARPRLERFECSARQEVHWQVGSRKRGTTHDGWEATVELLGKAEWAPGLVGSRVSLYSEADSIRESSFGAAVCEAALSSDTFKPGFKPFAGLWRDGRAVSQLSVGTLKSLLQKAVRRGMARGALFCAVEFMIKDRVAFFRRMPIIVLEDSILHPDFDFLVWLTLATAKGFIPPMAYLRKCLLIVLQVTTSKTQDLLDSELESVSLKEIDRIASEDLRCQRARTLVRSILFRESFGGMPGDMRMLRGFAALWARRFQRPCPIAARTSPPADGWLSKLKAMHTEDCAAALQAGPADVQVPVAGIDFHCAPWMLDAFPSSIGPDDVRSAMWEHHSSKNARRLGWAAPGKGQSVDGQDLIAARRESAVRRARRAATWAALRATAQRLGAEFLQARLPPGVAIQSDR